MQMIRHLLEAFVSIRCWCIAGLLAVFLLTLPLAASAQQADGSANPLMGGAASQPTATTPADPCPPRQLPSAHHWQMLHPKRHQPMRWGRNLAPCVALASGW